MGKVNSLIIDFEFLSKEGLEAYELLELYDIYESYEDLVVSELIEDTLKTYESNGYIKIVDGGIIVREKLNKLIELCSTDAKIHGNAKRVNKTERAISNEVDSRIKEFRHLWKGIKPGSMGDPKACKSKLKKWMKDNPEYSFDEVLKAAEVYLADQKDIRYIQRADYFIYKQERDRGEISRLSAYIDEEVTDDDWTTQVN